jgi:hypothetical protein
MDIPCPIDYADIVKIACDDIPVFVEISTEISAIVATVP